MPTKVGWNVDRSRKEKGGIVMNFGDGKNPWG
jgi:hypothetical protein